MWPQDSPHGAAGRGPIPALSLSAIKRPCRGDGARAFASGGFTHADEFTTCGSIRKKLKKKTTYSKRQAHREKLEVGVGRRGRSRGERRQWPRDKAHINVERSAWSMSVSEHMCAMVHDGCCRALDEQSGKSRRPPRDLARSTPSPPSMPRRRRTAHRNGSRTRTCRRTPASARKRPYMCQGWVWVQLTGILLERRPRRVHASWGDAEASLDYVRPRLARR